MLMGSVSGYFCPILFWMKLPNSSLITKPKLIHTANKPLENVSTDLSEVSPYTGLRLSLQCCSLHLLEINSAKTSRTSWNVISLGWNLLKLMDMLLLEIPVGLSSSAKVLRTPNYLAVILNWRQGMDDLRTGLSSPGTNYWQVKTSI